MSNTRRSDIADQEVESENEKIRITLLVAKEYLNHVPSLEIPTDPIAVPSSTRRSGLSAIVNHLLHRKLPQDDENDENEKNEDDKLPSLPFDFIVNQKLLRTSIEVAARREGLNLEQAIEIQYFPALPPPLQQETNIQPEPDWIYSLSYCSMPIHKDNTIHETKVQQGYLVSGSATGSIRIMDTKDNTTLAPRISLQHSFQPHTGPVTCISTLPRLDTAESVVIASGSMDQTLKTHLYTPSTSQIQSLATLRGGHFASISSVKWANSSMADTNAWLASGDFDGGLCIWKVNTSYDETMSDNKLHNSKKIKREINNTSSNTATTAATISSQDQPGPILSPAISFKAHTYNLSGIVWSHDSTDSLRVLISSSWDHSIKSWDMEKQNNITTLNGSKVVTSISRCMNSDVVATGHPDCTVRLWDMRSSAYTKTSSHRPTSYVSDNTLLPRYVGGLYGIVFEKKRYYKNRNLT